MENQIELDYEGSDQDPEEIEVVDNLKLVDVMHMLEQIGDFFFFIVHILTCTNYEKSRFVL